MNSVSRYTLYPSPPACKSMICSLKESTYSCCLSSFSVNDSYLQKAASAIPKHSIFLIEDIDCAFPLPCEGASLEYSFMNYLTGEKRVCDEWQKWEEHYGPCSKHLNLSLTTSQQIVQWVVGWIHYIPSDLIHSAWWKVDSRVAHQNSGVGDSI